MNGHTAGISHTAEKIKVKVVCAKSGLRQWTTKCLDVRVDLKKNVGTASSATGSYMVRLERMGNC